MLPKRVNKKRVKLFLLTLVLAGSIFLLTTSALAQETIDNNTNQEYVGPLGYKLQIPIGNMRVVDDLGDYIRNFYNYFMLAAAVLATFMIMFGGYIWLTAMGNREKISRAKEFIFSAVTGLLLALFSYVLLYTINPSIVELKPLDIDIIKPGDFGGPVASLCAFDQIDSGTGYPVLCEFTIKLESQGGEKIAACTGFLSNDPDDICQISTDPRGSKSGTNKSSLHVAGRGLADVNNSKGCGVLSYNAGLVKTDGWFVGSDCTSKRADNGMEYDGRCILDGDEPKVVMLDTTTCDYDLAKEEWCEDEEMIGLCGCIENMKCYGDEAFASGPTCSGLSTDSACVLYDWNGTPIVFLCDPGVQSQIDKNLLSDDAKENYLEMARRLDVDAEKVSAFSDNSLGRCVGVGWSCGLCGAGSPCDPGGDGCNCSNSNSCYGTCCGHRNNSDHYCNSSGQSHAIDFGNETYAKDICNTAKTVFGENAYIKNEGDHIHLGFGQKVCDDPDDYNLGEADCGEENYGFP